MQEVVFLTSMIQLTGSVLLYPTILHVSGMLEVYVEYRRKGIGRALESFLINRHLSMGYTPYGNVVEGNGVSLALQEKMGLCVSKQLLYWVSLKT